MSNLAVENMEPDPAATSLPNDATVKTEGGDPSAPTDIAAETATTEANGSIKAEVEPKVETKEEVEPKVETKEEVEPKVETKEEVEPKVETKEEVATENEASAAVKGKEEEKKFDPTKPRFYDNGVLKTTVQQDDSNRNNSRYDPSVLPISNDHEKIRAQVEFYFGDTNLPKDNHMMGLTGGAENRPVKIQEILKFGRMKHFQPQSEVAAALKASKFLEITGEDGQEQIIRRVAFDPTKVKTPRAEARSVYVKGFGNEEPSSQFDIEAFFAPYGPTNEVRLRRTDLKLFKGSVFVEFANEDLAKKFLELDPKPLWKGVHILEIMSKRAYTEGKEQDIRDGKIQPAGHKNFRGNSRGRGNFRGRGDRKDHGDRGGRSDRDPNDWKKRREDDRASGFKDNRGGKDNSGGRGDRRGGNRGRGGDRRGNDRAPRNNDKNRERDDKNKEVKTESKDGEKTEVKTEAKVDSPKNEKKRAREDDNVEQAPAKKVDTKSEVVTNS